MSRSDQDSPSYWLSITNKPLELPQSADFLGACNPVSGYDFLDIIGEGTYGIVHRARDPSGKIVAIKQLRLDDKDDKGEYEKDRENGIPLPASREISILRTLKHRNIINVLDIAVDDGIHDQAWKELYMVMEYAEQDIASLIDRDEISLKLGEVKCLFRQLLEGLEYLHGHYIIHRDVKTENLLLTDGGILKLADFNTARPLPDPPRPLSPNITTIWYAAPEVLLATSHYSPSIDIFSAALVLAELLLWEPVIQGLDPIAQLNSMIKLLGSPSRHDLNAFADMGCPGLSLWRREGLVPGRADNLGRRFERWGRGTVDMISGLLMWDPRERCTASEALGKQGRSKWMRAVNDWWNGAFTPEELPKWSQRKLYGSKGNDRDRHRADEERMLRTGKNEDYVFDFEDTVVARPAKRQKGS